MLRFQEAGQNMTAKDKFRDIFQSNYLVGKVMSSTLKGKPAFEVTLQKIVGPSMIKDILKSWEDYGTAKYIKPNQFAPCGTLFFYASKKG